MNNLKQGLIKKSRYVKHACGEGNAYRGRRTGLWKDKPTACAENIWKWLIQHVS
jgi:hypothetical protein